MCSFRAYITKCLSACQFEHAHASGQITRCESCKQTTETLSCHHPIIFYGGMENYGIPCNHANNDYDRWCREIGYPGFGSVLKENGFYTGALKWCSENAYKWCDWMGGHLEGTALDKTEAIENERIERLICSKGNYIAYRNLCPNINTQNIIFLAVYTT